MEMQTKLRKGQKVLITGVLSNGEEFRSIEMKYAGKGEDENTIVLLDKKRNPHTVVLANNKEIVNDYENSVYVTLVQVDHPVFEDEYAVAYESNLDVEDLAKSLVKRNIDELAWMANICLDVRRKNEWPLNADRLARTVILSAKLQKALEGSAMNEIELYFDKNYLLPEDQPKVKTLYSPTGMGQYADELYFGLNDKNDFIPIVKIKDSEKNIVDVDKLYDEANKLAFSIYLNKNLTEEEIIKAALKEAYKILGINDKKKVSYLDQEQDK